MAINEVTAKFTGRIAVAEMLNYQYDIKQVLIIEGLELPQAYQVDFCNVGDSTTVTMVGDENGVQIPDSVLATGKDIIAYIVLVDAESVQTRYEAGILVHGRPTRSNIQPTPAQQTTIDSLVDALNDAVEDAQAAQSAAESAASMLQNVSATATTLDAGSSATASYNDSTFTFGIPKGDTGATGADGKDGKDGKDGANGQDGFSPVVAVTEITGGHEVTITDADGDHTFDVMDGVTPPQELYWCIWGTTTSAQIEQALTDGKLPVVVNEGHYYLYAYKDSATLHRFESMYGTATYFAYCNNGAWTKGVTSIASISSPALTGTPTAPTANAGTNTTQIATTEFVQTAVGTTETVSGSTPTITGEANKRYVCGEVSTISITPPNSGIIDVIFESGSTPTVLTVPNTVQFPSWFDATSLEADTTYEINIMDGVYAAVMTWA